MPKIQPTPQAEELCRKLNENGVNAKLEHWDRHKHVDIAVLDASLYIEIDEIHHYLSPRQLEKDIERDHYSELDGFATIRIPAFLIDNNLDKIARAIIHVVENRRKFKKLLG